MTFTNLHETLVTTWDTDPPPLWMQVLQPHLERELLFGEPVDIEAVRREIRDRMEAGE